MRQRLRVARRWGLVPSQFDALPEADRAEMLAEEELVCPQCGHLRSVCSNPEGDWYAQRSMCYVTAAEAVTHRKLNEKFKGGDRGTKPHPLDGLNLWVADQDLTPDDPYFKFKPGD